MIFELLEADAEVEEVGVLQVKFKDCCKENRLIVLLVDFPETGVADVERSVGDIDEINVVELVVDWDYGGDDGGIVENDEVSWVEVDVNEEHGGVWGENGAWIEGEIVVLGEGEENELVFIWVGVVGLDKGVVDEHLVVLLVDAHLVNHLEIEQALHQGDAQVGLLELD